MNDKHRRRSGRFMASLAALLLGSGGTAQYFTPSFQNYQTYAQRTVGYVAATVKPDFTLRVVESALSPSAAPASYKSALSKTNLTVKGGPTQQKNCAAMVQKPADQRQMAALCVQLFEAAQSAPGFHRNNLAAGLTLLLGASLQVSRDTELTDAEVDALERGLNDILVDTGVMRGKAADLQAMYESSVMTGGLIVGIAERGADDADPELTRLAKLLAAVVLKGFGLE